MGERVRKERDNLILELIACRHAVRNFQIALKVILDVGVNFGEH